MAKNINLSDFTTALVFENPFVAEAEEEVVFNTGLASVAGEEATVAGSIGPAFTKKHVASIRLFKNNEYVYLNPGEKLTIKVDNANALAYYLGIGDTEILKLTNRDSFEEEESGSGE